ncbi:MAG: HAMP domain-containing sensor histidine kinase, partial [Planctomycetota bacterium]
PASIGTSFDWHQLRLAPASIPTGVAFHMGGTPMSSLRRDLALSLIVGVGVTYVLGGWLLWALVRANSRDDFDAALLAKAGALGTLLTRTDEGIDFDFADEVMPEFHRPREPEYFELWIEGGGLLERSLSLGMGDLPRRVGPVDAPQFFDLTLPDGRAGRAVGISSPVDYPDAAAVDHRRHDLYAEIVVAVSRDSLDRGNERVLRALLLTGGALIVAGMGVVWVALRRCGAKLHALTDQLTKVDGDSLDTRIETSDLVTELRPLGEALNALVERLCLSFARERRMTSNIAHELRTPVAELRAAVDVARQWPDDHELSAQALEAASSVSLRMSSTIQTLLRLGRLQSGGLSLEITEVDLAHLIREVEGELAVEAGRRGCRVEHTVQDDAVVQTDEPLARVLVRNLLENAITHSPENCRIVSELRRSGGVLRWRLANPTRGLTASDVRFLAEPFWQKEESRSGERHPGLGLALSQAICASLGWKLRFGLVSEILHACLYVRRT